MSKGGGAGAGAGAGAGGYGAGAGAAAGGGAGAQPIHPISSLHPYHTRWTIKARVTAKGDKRTWQNAKGEGSLFSVDLLDSSGGQIKATMFKDAVDKFFDVFQENHVYLISKGQLKPANKKFSRLPNEYELTLNADAEVLLVEDDQEIQQNRFDFVPIEGLQKAEPNDFVDVIGVLTVIAPLSNITSKAGQELKKRALTLMDQSLCQVEVTLWGEQAEKYDEGTLALHSVVAIKSCKVSDFGGRSLSSSFQSQVFLNPDNAEAHKLAEWFAANGAAIDIASVQNLSKMSRGGGEGAGAGAAGNVRKMLSDIKDDNLGMREKVSNTHFACSTKQTPASMSRMSETCSNGLTLVFVSSFALFFLCACHVQPDFFTVRATITFFKHDWEKGSLPWYMACPTVGCNKKVTEDSGSWHCEKCSRSYPNASPRYILSLMVCDPTGSTWLTAFNDAAQALLGGTTAEQLNQLIQQDQKDQGQSPSTSLAYTHCLPRSLVCARFSFDLSLVSAPCVLCSASAYFKQNNFREYLFKIRAKAETGNDQEVRVRSHILSATPINPIAECNYLFNEIAKYD